MTQGCEYTLKEITIPDEPYTSVELHLIDIAGQNIFKEITIDLLCNANQVMLVYDCTNPESFRLLRDWHDSIKQENNSKGLTGVVIGNKADLEGKIAVPREEGEAFAQQIGFEFFEVSALQSRGIEDPFKMLAKVFH